MPTDLVVTAATSLMLGLLSVTSPCILPLYPGFLAYLSGQSAEEAGRPRYWLGLCVLAGALTMMLALGGIVATLAIPTGDLLAFVVPLGDAAILGLGLLLLFDRNPFRGIAQIRVPVLNHPLLNAFFYGLLYGPLTLPCSGPLVVGIFALSFSAAEAFDKLWVFLWFGIGFGVPLFALSLFSGVFQRRLTLLFARHGRLVNAAGGLLLIGVAAFDAAQNWPFFQLYLSGVGRH